MSTYIFCILSLLTLLNAPIWTDEASHKKAWAHLILSDPRAALSEIEAALNNSSDKKTLLRTKILCLAALQNESALLRSYNEYLKEYPEEEHDAELLEAVCWAILRKGAEENNPLIRLEAGIGAFYSQDAKSVPLLTNLSFDPNIGIRTFSFFVFSEMHDEIFEKRALEAAGDDLSPFVRKAAINALGNMRSKKAIPFLKAILENSKSSAEEKLSAMQALSNIILSITPEELLSLTKSPHPYLRALACELALKLGVKDSVDPLFPLILDSSFEVKTLAIQVIGVLGKAKVLQNDNYHNELIALSQKSSPEVALYANWLLFLLGDVEAEKRFVTYLTHENRKIRLLAASLTAHTGKLGLDISSKWLEVTEDPLVAINLSLHLIRQRHDVDRAQNALKNNLLQTKERIDWRQDGICTFIAPNQETHLAVIPRYPEAKDLACRLDLYGILATCSTAGLEAMLSSFFEERSWGISGMAACLLLQEGDESAMESVKKLLQAESLEIRLQAAFILAIGAQDPDALSILQESYPTVGRELKEQILVAMGSIGAKSTISFLRSCLLEQSTILRLRASGALLRCLYH